MASRLLIDKQSSFISIYYIATTQLYTPQDRADLQ